MNIGDIAFPNLGLYFKDVPQSFNVFGLDIALYGVLVACGMLFGTLLAAYVAKKTGWDTEIIWDFVVYAIIISVIGARIYYVIFQWDYYKANPLEIFNLRQGGLAIYGGVICAFATVFGYSKIKKIDPLRLGDTCVPGLALGQVIGRWGNYFNREVFGEYTNNLLAMRLPIDAVRESDISANILSHVEAGTNYIQVHPTFLYEGMWNLVLTILMVVFWKKKKFSGEVILWYLGGYGLGRAWIEQIRTDQLFIPHTHVPVSQVLAIALVIFSIAVEIAVRIKLKKKSA